MQIPVYQQQTSVGGGAPLPRADATPVSPAIGQALSNAGQGMANVAQGFATEATVEQRLLREQEEQDAKAWSGKVASDSYLEWQKNLDDRKAAATGGAPNFTPDFLTDFDKYASDTVSSAPTPQAKQFLQQHLTSMRTQLGAQALSFEASARVADRVNNTAAAIDNWSNVVYSDPSKAGVALATIQQTMPDVGPEARDKLMKTAQEKIPFFAASGALERDAQAGNIAGIQATRAMLEGKDGESMDPARRASLITKAYGFENGILAAQQRQQQKADAEAAARETAATNAYNKVFENLWSKGRYLSMQEISETSAVVAGTTLEKPFQDLVKSQSQVAGFASMSLTQQESELERMRAAGSDPTLGVTSTEQKTYEQFEKINAAAQQAYKENPWKAAQDRGVIRDVPSVTITDVNSALQLIAQRMPQIGIVEDRAVRQISPLQPDEAEQLGRVISVLPPNQAASALAAIGNTIGTQARVADLARQMGDKDRPLGMAMAFSNAQTTAGRFTAELVLSGARALKDGTVKPDTQKEIGWRSDIAREIGDATLNQEVRQQWIDSAYLIQAAISAEGGGTDISRAVNLATGGLRIQRDGSKIPRPYGMSDDTFTTRVNGLRASDFIAQAPDGNVYSGGVPIPLDKFAAQLSDASLVHAGQGKYAVRAGTGFVMNKAGQRIIVDLNPQRPQSAVPSQFKSTTGAAKE